MASADRRALTWVGLLKGRAVELFPVAWCKVCKADRLLVNPRKWPASWGDDRPAPIAECVHCGNTVTITSRRPKESVV